jgi:HEAT repeat protein
MFRGTPFVQNAIKRFRALAAAGVHTVPELISAYPDLPTRTQGFALWALGIMRDRRAVPLLIRVCRDEPARRSDAATALGLLGGKRAYGFAVQTLRSVLAKRPADADLAETAVLLVVHMPGEHGRLLDDPQEPIYQLVDLLRRTDRPAGREARGALFAIEHGDWPAWWWEGRDPD